MSGKRIVVVDDDPDFLKYIRIVLRSAGYKVDTAASAVEGLALIRSAVPDLIISDLMMSYTLEGIELAHEITHDPVLVDVPLLVVTSIAHTMDAVGFDEETAQAIRFFFTKPVSPDELLARIGSCLSEGDE